MRKLALPIDIELNQKGTSYFINKNKSLNKFKNIEKKEVSGMCFDEVDPSILQYLLHLDFIANVETCQIDYSGMKKGVIDLYKIINYAIFYRTFDIEVYHKILENKIILNWNRQNLKEIYDKQTIFSHIYIKEYILREKKFINDLKKEIITSVSKIILESSDTSSTKNIRIFTIEKFLNNLRPELWFLLHKFRNSENFLDLIYCIEISLIKFINRVKIIEFFSLFLVELLKTVEELAIIDYINKKAKFTLNAFDILHKKEMRQDILNSMVEEGYNTSISFSLKNLSDGSNQNVIRFKIKIYSQLWKNYIAEVINNPDSFKNENDLDKNNNYASIHNPIVKPVGGPIQLKEVDENELVNIIGLGYLKTVMNDCKKEKIQFNSSMQRAEDKKQTVTTFNFSI